MSRAFNPHILLLTGPKHAGKTSVGRALAHLCKEEFIDLDELVEKQTGKSPRTLYREAPERFRQAEARALATLIEASPGAIAKYIVAAGGGIIDNDEAMALLKKAEVLIIYLEVSPETAWERIGAARKAGETLPPFLDTPDPQKTHRDLHQRRAAAYKSIAHSIIQAEGKDPEYIGREIIHQFR
jgi:shikimate kinase